VGRDVAAFLAAQPVDALPVSAETRRRLRLLGVRTLEGVAAIPPSALAAQFGPEGELAWRLAQGQDEEPVRPRLRLERVVEHIDFETPLANREALLVAAEQALTRALRQPLMLSRAARRLTVRASTERATYWERSLTFKEALADRDRVGIGLHVILDEAQLPGPVSRLSLELAGLTEAPGRQLPLPLMRRRVREHLEEAMRQLKTQYGYCPVGRIVEVEPWSRIPERRLALIDFDP
jgi:DNA polymerase-4/protein ImuB